MLAKVSDLVKDWVNTGGGHEKRKRFSITQYGNIAGASL